MAINLNGFNMETNNQENPGISLNLQKNQTLDLTKKEPGLKNVILGAGWDVAQTGQSFDLDIAAFLLDANGKVNTLEDVIFFNNKATQGVALRGDNLTGVGEGDDEQIFIKLNEVNSRIKKIVFIVTIHGAAEKRQTFGMVNNAYVRLLNADKNDQEICRFALNENSSTATSVIFAQLEHDGNNWQFKAVGEGKFADLNGMLALYQ